MRARICLPADGPKSILVSLCVHDSKARQDHRGRAVQLVPGQWQTLEWQIPYMQDVCLSQAGLSFRNMASEVWKGVFYLDYLDWDGNPSYSQNFQTLRIEYGAAEQWTYLRGFWRLEDDGYHGSGIELNESYTGDLDWEDMNLKLKIKPLIGDLHGVSFRVQGALRSYCAALLPGKLCLLKKQDGDLKEMASIPFDWELEQSYQIEVLTEGNVFNMKLKDTILTWEDKDSPYLHGQVGLLSGAGCHTCFEKLQLS